MSHAPMHAHVKKKIVAHGAWNLSLVQWNKIDSDLFCPITPRTKLAQWSKFLSCSIVAHPSGKILWDKKAPWPVFLVAPSKEMFVIVISLSLSFSTAIN